MRKGNKVFMITPKAQTSKSWTYFIVPTRFKPGVTYKVEFDYRLLGDLDGNEANNIPFAANFRYTDYNKNGELKVKMDHAKATEPQAILTIFC